MHLFYDPHINPTGTHQLPEEESKHAVRVLRLAEGSELAVLDGRGNRYTCKIIEAHPKRCRVEITDHFQGTLEPQLHIAISPTKQMERMEWLVEKATEIGITELTFLECTNSERVQLKLDRLERKAISAMKQSQRLFLPKLNALTSFTTFVEAHPKGMLAHCYSDEKQVIPASLQAENALMLIGPEGDFAPKELELASEKGYKMITLGENRLRTETAALYAIVLMKSYLG